MPGKDEEGRTLMKTNPSIAPLISNLFHDFALGCFSQNELRLLPKYKSLNLSKSGLSRMLQQIVYAGKIRIPAYKEEDEQIVDALHEPLISMETFEKVQNQLIIRNRYKQKAKKLNPKFPLRGFLKCSSCRGNLTASDSTSKTGAKHGYYHCNPKKGCRERFKINDAHEAFEELLNNIRPAPEVCDLFRVVLEEKYKESEKSKRNQLQAALKDILMIESKKEQLTYKLLDRVVDDETPIPK